MKGKRITVIAKMKAKRGMEDKLKSELLNLVVPSRLDDGCINYDLYQATVDKSVFIFHENWNSKENLDKHLQTPHLKSFAAKADTMLAEPPEGTLHEMIS